MTQQTRLLKHLETGAPIDPMSALSVLGIYRLGARIFDLKAAGHAIERELVETQNRFGETCRVARYTLVRP